MRRVLVPVVGFVLLLLGLAGAGAAGLAAPPAAAAGPRPAAPATGGQVPLIFIPGIEGSFLEDRANGGNDLVWINPLHLEWLSRLSLYPADNPSPGIVATDIIPHVLQVPGYQQLLDTLTAPPPGGGGYTAYDIAGDPGRRTTAGCDTSQTAATFFPFAYDWRKDNAVSAAALKDYIGCIARLHPGSPVDILTHSMGGLVARRYILDNAAAPGVRKLVTIAAPWLGAPQTVYALQTGDDFGSLALQSLDPEVKYLLGSFTAAHQVLPARAYFTLGGAPPLGENDWDFDGNGRTYETYADYAHYLAQLNAHYGHDGFQPGTAADAFHAAMSSAGGQDDWRADATGIRYYHIYGVQTGNTTLVQSRASYVWTCAAGVCTVDPIFRPVWGRGDGTVPLLSAERIGAGLDLNAPGAQRIPYVATSEADNANVEHGGLTRNAAVLAQVLQILGAAAKAAPARPDTLPPPAPYNYVELTGATALALADAAGNPVPPDLGTHLLSAHTTLLTVPATGAYSVTLQVGSAPLALSVAVGTSVTSTRSIRYQDLVLPLGVSAILTFTTGAVGTLHYDADHNGTFETAVPPTVDVTNPHGVDTDPPRITAQAAPAGTQTRVTLTATDSGSGLRDLLYSLDGTHFQPYTGALTLNPAQTPQLYALADDHLANRGSLVFPVPGSSPPPTPTPGATPCAVSFGDVQAGDYFYTPVLYLACRGVLSGYGDGTFRPYNPTTRGQLAKIVVGAEGWPLDTSGGPHFADVPASHPFYAFVETAYHRGVLGGYADGTFRPGANVTRGQVAKIVVGAQGWAPDTTGGPHFADVPASNPFYAAIETAYHHGILGGYADGTFRWGAMPTRGQIAKIVYGAVTGP